MTRRITAVAVALAGLTLVTLATTAEPPPGETAALGPHRITQAEITSGEMSLREIRAAGLRIFTTLLNKLDGYGDGPMDPDDHGSPGGRPTLGGNGTFLRVNGLDARGCIECHAMVSAATSPPRLGIGGVGGSNSNAIIMPHTIDMGDPDLDDGIVFDGRFANPPFVFGAGAVELLAAEMTEDLQALKAQALDEPGREVPLVSKGVRFGTLEANAKGELDTSRVEGVSPDLVVRPFGRKGEFFSIRDFDIGAVQFHFGMQPIEVFGEGTDDDRDGVTNEILVGELSALSAFVATLERPYREPLEEDAAAGLRLFRAVGCVDCHVARLETRARRVRLRQPEVPTDPGRNVFLAIDLSRPPTRFERNGGGGITVRLFSDLKRHDMGEELAENFAMADDRTNREFVTARLWGIADTAPYLHDGRATTLTEAILAHGGEAQLARDGFESLNDSGRMQLLAFLRSLRTPEAPAAGLLAPGDDDDDEHDDDEHDDEGADDLGADERS